MTSYFTANLNVGDTVYADFSKYRRVDVREGRVIKKSPTGVVQVDFGTSLPYSFMPQGHERGVASWGDRAQLISKDHYDRSYVRMMTQKRERVARDAIKNVTNIAATEKNKTELINALQAALTAVIAI